MNQPSTSNHDQHRFENQPGLDGQNMFFSLKPASRKQQGLICTVLSSIELHQHTYEHYGVGNCVLDDSHQPMGLSKHRVFCEPTLTFDICCLPADFHLWLTYGISILDNSSQSGPQV